MVFAARSAHISIHSAQPDCGSVVESEKFPFGQAMIHFKEALEDHEGLRPAPAESPHPSLENIKRLNPK